MIGKLIDVVTLMGGKYRITYEVDAVDEHGDQGSGSDDLQDGRKAVFIC